jgi:hypothetical protein
MTLTQEALKNDTFKLLFLIMSSFSIILEISPKPSPHLLVLATTE